jgi:hypothetical protein
MKRYVTGKLTAELRVPMPRTELGGIVAEEFLPKVKKR